MPAPSTVPNWADGVGADVTEPSASQKSGGWIQGQRPPRDYVNWFWNLIALWIAWFSTGGTTQKFATPAALVAAIDVGETGIVQGDATAEPFGPAWDYAHGVSIDKVVVDGVRAYAVHLGASGVYLFAHTAEDGTLEWSVNLGTITDICTDGSLVYAVTTTSASQLWSVDAATGATVDQEDLDAYGDTPVLICTDGVQVYVAFSSGNIEARSMDLATVNWTNSDLATVPNQIVTNGRYIAATYPESTGAFCQIFATSDGDRKLSQSEVGDTDGEGVDFGLDLLWIGTQDKFMAIGERGAVQNPTIETYLDLDDWQSGGNGPTVAVGAGIRWVVRAVGENGVGYSAFTIQRAHQPPTNNLPWAFFLDPTTDFGGANPCLAAATDDRYAFFGGLGSDADVDAENFVGGSGTKTMLAIRLPGATQPRLYRHVSTSDQYRRPFHGVVVPE